MNNSSIVIIVGYSRSGTTLVSQIIGSFDNIHLELEPHANWRIGNFCKLNDEDFKVSTKLAERIRQKMFVGVDKEIFAEKSPINSLRPDLVYSVFPNAKIIYVQRNPVKCIKSNVKFSRNSLSFDFSVLLRKYFSSASSKAQKKENKIEEKVNKFRQRSIFKQIDIQDIFCVAYYVLGMLSIKFFKEAVPFGPKIKNFAKIVKEEGLINYHIRAYQKTLVHKNKYEKLYGDKMQCFQLEDLISNNNELIRLLNFIEVAYDDSTLRAITSTFVKSENRAESALDLEIQESMKHLDIKL